MYPCWIYRTLNLLFVHEELVFTLRPQRSMGETLDSAHFHGDYLLRHSRNSELLFFHFCFPFTVSEPLQCYQRAGILHSFPVQRRSYHLKYASVQNYDCGNSNVPCTVSCLLLFLASFKVFLVYRDFKFLGGSTLQTQGC